MAGGFVFGECEHKQQVGPDRVNRCGMVFIFGGVKLKIESIYIYVIHENESYCLVGDMWFKSDEYGELYVIRNDDLIAELKCSFQKMTETLSDCPACKSELSYKHGVCRNSLCVMHYDEFKG